MMISREVLSRCLPFALYMAIMALSPWLAELIGLEKAQQNWLYALRVAAPLAAIIYFWRDYAELRAQAFPLQGLLATLAAGLLVFVIWINLAEGWVVFGTLAGFVPKTAAGEIDWPLIVVRWCGAALVVPLMEELFWRSFLQRWLDKPAFLSVDPRLVTFKSLLIASLLFGSEHSQWLAGIIAGLFYGYLYRRYGNLWLPTIAHAITNGVLGIWVVAGGHWQFW